MELWRMYDIDGQEEPFLDNAPKRARRVENPPLFILNKKRGTTKMRRAVRRKGRRARRRTTTALAVNRPRQTTRRATRRRTRRHSAFASNAPRRARRTTARGRRGFRKNPPDILGFNLKDIAIAGAAVVVKPFIEKQLMSILPTSIASTTSGRWAVKVGSAVAVGYGFKKFIGGKAGELALIALGAGLIDDAVDEFAPDLKKTLGLGYYPSTPRGLGYYPSTPRGLGGFTPGIINAGGVYPALVAPSNHDVFANSW